MRAVETMPDCFSRPICRLAMLLNDEARDEQRQQLLPFVTRLACADTKQVEWEREVYIAQHLRRRISWQDRLEVLEGALAIGRQADVLATEQVSPGWMLSNSVQRLPRWWLTISRSARSRRGLPLPFEKQVPPVQASLS